MLFHVDGAEVVSERLLRLCLINDNYDDIIFDVARSPDSKKVDVGDVVDVKFFNPNRQIQKRNKGNTELLRMFYTPIASSKDGFVLGSSGGLLIILHKSLLYALRQAEGILMDEADTLNKSEDISPFSTEFFFSSQGKEKEACDD